MSEAVRFDWYSVTTRADKQWKAALAHFWQEYAKTWDDPEMRARANAQIMAARADYRANILGWYRKLCVPMKPTECTPNSVAELLAEAWDLGERPFS